MKTDVYDTYATDSDGAILHFEAIVRSGMCPQEVEKRIHAFVGAGEPEIEMELDRWKSSAPAAEYGAGTTANKCCDRNLGSAEPGPLPESGCLTAENSTLFRISDSPGAVE